MLIGVIASLIAAAVLAGWRWLRVEDNRQALRERFCRHEWRSLDERNEPGSSLVFVSPYAEECVKCGARR